MNIDVIIIIDGATKYTRFNKIPLLLNAIQKKYEILSDIVTEHNGKDHGSQRDRDPKTGLLDLLVYYEVPLGQSDEEKQKFDNFLFVSVSR